MRIIINLIKLHGNINFYNKRMLQIVELTGGASNPCILSLFFLSANEKRENNGELWLIYKVMLCLVTVNETLAMETYKSIFITKDGQCWEIQSPSRRGKNFWVYNVKDIFAIFFQTFLYILLHSVWIKKNRIIIQKII